MYFIIFAVVVDAETNDSLPIQNEVQNPVLVNSNTYSPDPPDNYINLTADSLRTTFIDGNPDTTYAEGNVQARFNIYKITADKAVMDHINQNALFTGKVVFTYKNQEVQGNKLDINLNTGKWKFYNAVSAISPEFADGYLISPLYTRGKSISGIGQSEITILNSELAGCWICEEYKDVQAREINIYPGSKIIFR
ncbi:MAG: LptA/OstA family protein, partial [Armatimonadota bacterium]